MKTVKHDGGDERHILTAMITSTPALAQIAAKWDPALMASKWAALVGGWCVQYFQKYEKAPGPNVERLFETWAARTDDTATRDAVQRLLSSLDGDYRRLRKQVNPDYVVDLAAKHFQEVQVSTLTDNLQTQIDLGNPEEASRMVTEFKRVELGLGSGVRVAQDKEAIKAALTNVNLPPLIEYPDGLGRFFGSALCRDAFVSFMAPEKRGKTWWLIDAAWRAVQQGRRVAYFDAGDMTQNQVIRRFAVRATGKPLTAGAVPYPASLVLREEDTSGRPHARSRPRNYKQPLDAKAAWKAMRQAEKGHDGGLLRVSCHPNNTLTVDGLSGLLAEWALEEWTPDVVVVDYADILAPLNNRLDARDQINENWKALRSLSQRLHCLVLTATQADAASYGKRGISRTNFSEDKRKLSHVTGMVGISADQKDEAAGLFRLNWLALRDAAYSEGRCCFAAGCLAVGNPAVLSCL